MSDAERDILKMLADKVITVDEAERLLKALNEREHRKEKSNSWGCGPHRHIGRAFESFGEMLADIGPMIKNTVEDVVTGLLHEEPGETDDAELTDVEPVEGQYEIPQGTHLFIRNDWKDGPGKGALVIQGVAGNACRIDPQGAKNVRVQQGSAHVVIRWGEGPLRVDVPDTVSMLKVRTKGGNILVKQVKCDLSVKTFAGNLEMLDIVKNFKAKTMGGHVTLALSTVWQGKGRAQAMGGNIAVAIPSDISLKVEAATIGGTIKVDERIRHFESKQFFPGRNTVNVQIGEQNADSALALKTMGGDIELRQSHAE